MYLSKINAMLTTRQKVLAGLKFDSLCMFIFNTKYLYISKYLYVLLLAGGWGAFL